MKRPITHALSAGLPLCRFTTKVPRDWPPGNDWVGPDDYARVTCPKCLKHLPPQEDQSRS
jgi:hypothetical protein